MIAQVYIAISQWVNMTATLYLGPFIEIISAFVGVAAQVLRCSGAWRKLGAWLRQHAEAGKI